jgi:hypothetical protein
MEKKTLDKAIPLIINDIESVSYDGMTRKIIDISHDGSKYIRFNLEDLSDGFSLKEIKNANMEYAKWRRLLLIKLERILGPEKYPYKNDNTNWHFEQVEVTYSTFYITFEFEGDSIIRYLRNKTLDDLLG